MLRVFVGVDSRALIAFHVLSHSILKRASQPVAITPLVLSTLPIKRRGLTEFSFSRWIVPWLCGYEGQALFLDSDILARTDVVEIFAMADRSKPISVVRHEGRLAFERPSLMVFQNDLCQHLTPEYVEHSNDIPSMWLDDASFGEIPHGFNFLVGYDRPTDPPPQVLHFTAGIPVWPETRGCDYADLYLAEMKDMGTICSWNALMGQSVHVAQVTERLARERADGQRQPAPAA